jgi:hypothetical protein
VRSFLHKKHAGLRTLPLHFFPYLYAALDDDASPAGDDPNGSIATVALDCVSYQIRPCADLVAVYWVEPFRYAGGYFIEHTFDSDLT